MMPIHPIRLAVWIAVAGISFGLALSSGWLILLGLVLPIAVLGGFLIFSMLQK